jgi:hypothetical protein
MTALAVAGLVLMGVLVILIGITVLQQALRLRRLFRGSVRFTWGAKPVEDVLPVERAQESAVAGLGQSDADPEVPPGWGFDR